VFFKQPKPYMSPKKKHKQGQQALTEAELAERVCSICEVPVPEHLILHQWDFAMNSANNADYAWEQLQDIWPRRRTQPARMRLLLARGQPGEQPPHLNGGRRLAAAVRL
jgi:hypothetical protein